MAHPEWLALPHGASGIEVGDFAIEFRPDKIVAFRKSSGDHYTLHVGGKSRVLDIHHTWRDAAGDEHHQTVFAMRHEHILPLLGEWSSLLTGLRLLRPLRLGWLGRHGIGVVWGLDPVATQEIARVTRKRSRRKRLVVDEEKLRSTVYVPEYLEEVRDSPDGAFSLFKGDRKIGVGFKATDQFGNTRLYWFKLHDLVHFSKTVQDHVIEMALRYAIPPERYRDHSVLEPQA